MAQHFRLASWIVDPDRNTFTGNGRTVKVEPKIMEVCVRLAQAPGSVVSKGELLDSVWQDISVGEDALTRAISELRRALEDDARNPRIVETIPKRGYRLIAAVEVAASEAPVESGRVPPAYARLGHAALLAAALVVLLIPAGVFWLRSSTRALPSTRALRPVASEIHVLVAAFENHTTDPALGDLLRGTVQHRLEGEGRIAIVPKLRVASALRLMRRNGEDVSQIETALEVARRAGDIAAVVAGELHRTPHEYVLTLRAVSAVDNRVLRTAVARGMDQSVLLAATEREAAVVREVVEQLAPEPLDPLPPVTTSSLTALRFFAQGVAVADSILSAQAGGWPKSLELFRSALEEDPEFAMAQVWLAMGMKFAEETELSYRGGTRAPPIHFRQHALESLALADRGFVSERERLFIQGVATMLLERPDEAIAAFETLLSTDSRFFELRTRSLLASIYATEARWPERRAQVLRLAQLVPNDVDVNVAAAEELILQDGGNVRGASVFVERARQHIVPEVAQRENTCWSVAWLEHLPVYESWVGGDTADAAMKLRALASQLNSRVAADRDAMATATGYLWLTLGRVADARKAFEAVGHVGQREHNLALLADLLDDRASMIRHLERQGWGYNPVPFARAGLVERARQIMKDPTVTGERKAQDAIAKAEPMIGTGRPREVIELLQPAIDMLRARPHVEFYNASLSLARAWEEAGSPSQALRVLEEAVRERPAYVGPGLAGAWWIKTQVQLAEAYRKAGRPQSAVTVDERLRTLLAHADPGHRDLLFEPDQK